MMMIERGATEMAKGRTMNALVKHGPTMTITVKPFPWDLGAKSDAQILNKVVEEVTTSIERADGTVRMVNPNQVIRTRREPWLATYERKGKLSAPQAAVAYEMLSASLGLVNQDPLAALRIDRSSQCFDAEADRVDARRKFRDMWALIPGFARPVIEHVIINDRSLRSMPGCACGASETRHLDRLQRGLDALARAWRR